MRRLLPSLALCCALAAPLATAQVQRPATDAPVQVEEKRWQGGAPLDNPNVRVHIVQKKPFADAHKHELVLYPGVPQVNGRFTQHTGSALQYVYHLQENYGLVLQGQYNWYANESGFNKEIINKVREQATAASALLLNWGAQAGVEVTPLYGKFAFYNDALAQFSFVLSGGAGVGSTKVLLRPESSSVVDGQDITAPDRFGDTGMKFMGSVGAGFRVQLGQRFALRLEVKDLLYTARADRVNGCNLADFDQLDAAAGEARPLNTAQVSSSCKVARFDGVDSKTGQNRADDRVLARQLVEKPSSDVLNVVSFYTGFSFLF